METTTRYYDSSYLETFWRHCLHGNFMGIGGELRIIDISALKLAVYGLSEF